MRLYEIVEKLRQKLRNCGKKYEQSMVKVVKACLKLKRMQNVEKVLESAVELEKAEKVCSGILRGVQMAFNEKKN